MSLSITPTFSLNTSRDSDSTTSLGSLCQCLTTLSTHSCKAVPDLPQRLCILLAWCFIGISIVDFYFFNLLPSRLTQAAALVQCFPFPSLPPAASTELSLPLTYLTEASPLAASSLATLSFFLSCPGFIHFFWDFYVQCNYSLSLLPIPPLYSFHLMFFWWWFGFLADPPLSGPQSILQFPQIYLTYPSVCPSVSSQQKNEV